MAALAAWALLSGCAAPGGGAVGGSDSPVNLANRGDETDIRKRARIRLELAVGYYQNGQFSIALDELRNALQTDPNYPDAIGVLALVYMELNERSLAEENFQKALHLAPNDSELNNNYGWFLCQNGREAQSIGYFQAAMRNPLYQTPAKPLTNAGVCSIRMRDLAAAESFLTRAFEIDPSSAVTMFNLADVYLRKGQYQRAWFYANRLNTTFDPTPQTLWLGIRVARKGGDRTSELNLVSTMRKRFPTSREAGLLARGAYDE
jgi:type IV pilus assembly protein PilF